MQLFTHLFLPTPGYTARQPAGVFSGWINLFQVYCFNGNGGYMQLFTQWP